MKKIVHRLNAHKLKANCIKIKTKFKVNTWLKKYLQ